MTAKEYLRQLKTLDCLIKAKELEKERLMALAGKVSVSLSEKVQGGSGGSMEDTIIKATELGEQINADIDKLVSLRNEARGLIDKLDNNNFKTILSMYYISNVTFRQIAKHMNYSIGGVFKMHGHALKDFGKIFKNH